MSHGKFELSKKSDTASINDAGEEKKERSSSAAKNTLDYLRDFVSLLSTVLLVFLLLFQVVVVSGSSMKNTLINGDYIILMNNILYSKPKQGDIIVASKDDFENGKPIIKRVIATEGQVVDYDFDANIVYVDGVALDESYTLIDGKNVHRDNTVTFPLTVDEGCIFVMGDNRNNSTDSRYTRIGQVDCREILGKAIILAFPGENSVTEKREFKRIGVLSNGK